MAESHEQDQPRTPGESSALTVREQFMANLARERGDSGGALRGDRGGLPRHLEA